MAESIHLCEKEQELYDEIFKLVDEFHCYYSHHMKEPKGFDEHVAYKEMSTKAHDLHMLLKKRGLEPQHHKYMLQNRGVPMDEVEFYNHLHPVEDLIAFINDPDANKDPEDSTMGLEFKMDIYTRRWKHYDCYMLTRTASGWDIRGASIFGEDYKCDKSGKPQLFSAFEHDSVSYPYNTGELLEWVWDQAAEGETKEAVQQAITDLGEWVSNCERSVPGGLFEALL